MLKFKEIIDDLRAHYTVERVIIHTKKLRILELSDAQFNESSPTCWQYFYKLDEARVNDDHGDGCSYLPKFAGLDWAFES